MAALRYEWVRISTVRSTRICLVLAVLLSAGLAFLIAAPRDSMDQNGTITVDPQIEWYGAFGFPLTFTAVLVAIVASQAIGQEYRFGLIRLTLTAFPSRVQVLVAKLTVVILASVAMVLASYLGSELGVTLRGHPLPGDVAVPTDSTFILRGAVFVVLWGLSAFALAGITRQTAVGIAVPLVSGLIVENLLGLALRDHALWIVKILPWSTANRWYQQPITSDGSQGGRGFGFDDLPIGWSAVGIFAVWVVALLALEVLSFLRRDA